jgi:plastocyanin
VRRLAGSLLLFGAAVAAAAPAVAGTPHSGKPQKRTVDVADNYYSPKKLTVNLKSRITWKWTDEAADVHDVKLVSAPKGVKKFQSEPGSAGFTYSKTFSKPGTYKLICTFHEEDNMRMTIVVRH